MATIKSPVSRKKTRAPDGNGAGAVSEESLSTETRSPLDTETKLDMFRTMLRSRRLDERAWVLHRQGKITFHISAMGHEAAQVGAAYALERGKDFVAPYYRDLALLLALGYTPREFALGLFGKV